MEKNAKIFNEGPKLNAFFSGNIKWKYAIKHFGVCKHFGGRQCAKELKILKKVEILFMELSTRFMHYMIFYFIILKIVCFVPPQDQRLQCKYIIIPLL